MVTNEVSPNQYIWSWSCVSLLDNSIDQQLSMISKKKKTIPAALRITPTKL
uniref:Uncharacterized protein n=1 Tax=Octopus bimaculoides TaxID=37653 RepID=A0A0L8FNG2_OCTBM